MIHRLVMFTVFLSVMFWYTNLLRLAMFHAITVFLLATMNSFVDLPFGGWRIFFLVVMSIDAIHSWLVSSDSAWTNEPFCHLLLVDEILSLIVHATDRVLALAMMGHAPEQIDWWSAAVAVVYSSAHATIPQSMHQTTQNKKAVRIYQWTMAIVSILAVCVWLAYASQRVVHIMYSHMSFRVFAALALALSSSMCSIFSTRTIEMVNDSHQDHQQLAFMCVMMMFSTCKCGSIGFLLTRQD